MVTEYRNKKMFFQTFVDWKTQVRKRARLIREQKKETGNAGTSIKPLTDLEEKLLALTGQVVVSGLNIPEIGIQDQIEIPINDADEAADDDNTTGNSSIIQENHHTPYKIKPPTNSRIKKKTSVAEALRKIIVDKNMNSVASSSSSSSTNNCINYTNMETLLTSIDRSLKSLVKIQNRKMQIDELRFRLENPQVEPLFTDDEHVQGSDDDESSCY